VGIEKPGIGIARQVIPLEFLLFVKGPIRLKITAGAKRPQSQHGFRTLQAPPRARQVHPIFDQMPTSPLNHPAGNGKALSQKGLILEIGLAIVSEKYFTLGCNNKPIKALQLFLASGSNPSTHRTTAFKRSGVLVKFNITMPGRPRWECITPLFSMQLVGEIELYNHTVEFCACELDWLTVKNYADTI
jgi:hypothetical protein